MPVYKRNRVWYYEFKIRGTRYKRSIPTAQSKRDAEQAEAEAKSQVHRGTYGQPKGDQPFSQFAKTTFRKWTAENWKRPEKATGYIKIFCEFFGRRTFAEISSIQIEAFKLHLKKTPMPNPPGVESRQPRFRSKKTINRYLAVLSRLFRVAMEMKIADKNPCRDVKREPEGEGRIRYLYEDEAQRLLAELDNQPDHLRHFVLIALHSGMRFGEIATLHKKYLDWQSNEIVLPDPKSGREERVPMNEFVAELLAELESEAINGWLLPNPRTGKPYTTLKKGMRKLLEAAQIPGFTFHCLRHSFATELLDQGASITTAQALLRHKHITTTQKYVHAKDERKRQAVAKMEQFWKKVPNEYPSENVYEFKTALNR